MRPQKADFLKYGLNLGASRKLRPLDHIRGLTSGPHPFGNLRQATQMLHLAEKFLHLGLRSQAAIFFYTLQEDDKTTINQSCLRNEK